MIKSYLELRAFEKPLMMFWVVQKAKWSIIKLSVGFCCVQLEILQNVQFTLQDL